MKYIKIDSIFLDYQFVVNKYNNLQKRFILLNKEYVKLNQNYKKIENIINNPIIFFISENDKGNYFLLQYCNEYSKNMFLCKICVKCYYNSSLGEDDKTCKYCKLNI